MVEVEQIYVRIGTLDEKLVDITSILQRLVSR